MKLPHINTKSPVFLPSTILALIFLAIIFLPVTFWKKLFNHQQFATVFTTATSGDWNSRTTWGVVGPYGVFETPTGVSVNYLNKTYVLDSGNNRIVVINPDNTTFATYDSLGLSYPQGIAISSTTGEIYIADTNNNRIVVLNPDGTASTTYTPGLIFPKGVTLSPTGEIYVTNTGSSTIVVLNPDGTASTTYSTGLTGPQQLAFSSSGDMYITDSNDVRVQSNLIGEWKFDNGRSNDSSGNLYNSSYNGASWLSTGGHSGRGGYSFNGSTNGHIQTTMPLSLIDDDSWTISVWAYGNSPATSWGWIIGEAFGSSNLFLLGKLSGANQMYVYITGCTSPYTVPGTDIFDGIYHHVVLVNDGGALSLYIDNSLIGVIVASGCVPTNGTNMRIGGRGFGAGEVWDGAIDDVRVYDRALTLGEISTLFSDTPVTNQIVVLNPDGTASTTYNSLGLSYPQGIAISSTTGEIYIADTNNNRIVVLNPDGTASTTYSTGLLGPQNLFLSSYIHIADTNHNRVVTLNFDGTEHQFEGADYPGISDNVVINTGTVTLTANQSVHDLTLASGGTLNLNGFTLNVDGNWVNSGGTLINNGGTINLVSTTTQSIMGTNTFENLTKLASTTSSLLFDPLNTITVTGNLVFAGSPGNVLSIAPNTGSLIPAFMNKIEGSGIPGLDYPYIISVSPITGRSYIYDNNNGAIVINPGGITSTTTFGAVSYPDAVEVSSTGTIYIMNNSTNSVVVMGEDGSVASTTYGSGVGLSFSYDLDTAASTGEIFITDSSNNRIVVLNPDGTVASTTYGSDLVDSFVFPYLIGVSPITDKIYIADHFGSGRIVVLNADGSVASTTFGENLGINFHNNSALTVSPSGTVYIANYAENVIFGLYEDGSIATTTLGQDLIDYGPDDIDTFSTGEIVIGDSNNNRVVILNSDGSASTTYKNSIPGAFNEPFGITHDTFNNIYVADYATGNVQKFDPFGNFISFLNTVGLGDLSQPKDIATDLLNNVYIADSNNNRVVKFDSSGNYATSSTTLNTTQGLVVDDFGYIYITKSSPNEILKLDSNLNIINSTSTYNGSTFSFCDGSLTLDPTESFLYVADRCNNRIVKLNTSDLSYVASSTGPAEAPFGFPYDIAIDTSGNLYVSDNSDRIIKLNSDFSYAAQWGTFGSGNSQFSGPNRLTVDSNNNLYVADQFNRRVQKFNLTTTFTPFNINYTGVGTTSYSYLSVSGSNNVSALTFFCLTGCTNSGGNTNWVFPVNNTPVYGGSSSYVPPAYQPFVWIPATTTPEVITTPAATTTSQDTATTTPIPTPVKPVVPVTPKPVTPPTTPSLPTVPTVPTTPVIEPTIPPQESIPTTEVKNDQSIIAPSLFVSIQQNITQTYLQAMGILNQAGQAIINIVNSPVGSVVTKVIATVGIVVGALSALAGIAFATPITFSEIWLVPTRILGLMLGALGIRKKQRPWGTVYDAITKRPLDPAYVTLIDTVTGKEVGTAITDLDGRYSFSVLPGTYKIVAAKTNYTFPSVKMMTAAFDEVYNDLYHGNEITITVPGEVITKNIPMDPQSFDWNEFTKNKMNINTFTKAKDITWARVSKYFFVLGFIISVVALVAAPRPYNMIIMGVYVFAYILNYFVFKPKKAGTLRDKTTGLPLSFAIIKVFREGMTEVPILKKIADKEGKYYALLPKGNYFIHIDKKNDDATYTTIYKSDLLTFDTGVVNQDVEV